MFSSPPHGRRERKSCKGRLGSASSSSGGGGGRTRYMNTRMMMMMMSATNRASAAGPETAAEPNKGEDTTGLLPPLDSAAGAGLAGEGITPQEWKALLEAGEVASLEQGQLLMSQGDIYEQPGDREVYLLLSGECRIEVQGKPAGRIATGDFVGEASFTSGRPTPRTATVRANSPDTRVAAWTWDALREFMDRPGNLRTKAALQAYWMTGLAIKLNDVMSALGGRPVVDAAEEAHKVGDYGYRYLEDMREVDSIVPVSAVTLAWWTFAREYRALRRTFRFGEFKDTGIAVPFSRIDRFLETSVFPVLRPSRVDLPKDPEVVDLQRRLGELKLSNKAIEDRETARIAATKALLEDETRKGIRDAGNILRSQTPWYVMVPYKILCWFLDLVFEDRPIQRFWFLETVARMPYFSYLSMLFLFETLGWWSGGAEVRKIHFAEEYNEMMHLRIMESLGGDTQWSDRFLARHAAIIYYLVLTLGYLVSPFLAYNFSELIESHAVDTYTEFAEVNKELLMSLPATPQALDYYEGGDMYLFDEFQTSRPAFSRRPTIRNLYDVFSSIRDDELEHVKTMFACERGKGALTSPNAAAATPRWDEDAAAELGFEEDDGDGVKSSSRGGGGRPTTTTTAAAAGGRNEINGLEGSSLRTDVARKTPLEVFSSAFDPLRKLAEAVEKEEVPRNGAGAAAAVGGGEEHRPAAVLNGAREGGEEGQQREEEGVEDGGVVAATKNGGEGIGKRIPSSSDSGENLSENRSEESV
ncbi:unnamed protein product [Pylaiella littoralis]